MAVDLFKRTSLKKAYDLVEPRNQMFLSSFFKEGQKHAANLFRVDKETGILEMAPLTKRGSDGMLIDKGLIKSGYVEPPNIRIYTPFDSTDLTQISLEQPNFLDTQNVNEMLANKIAKHLQRLKDMINLRKEKLIADIFLNGAITYGANGVTYSLDYSRSGSAAISAASAWSTKTVDPAKDFESVQEYAGGHFIDTCVMSLQSWQEFQQLTPVQTMLHYNNIDAGSIALAAKPFYKGKYMGVDIFVSYDKCDASSKLITAEKCIFFSRANNEFTFEYGICSEINAGGANVTDVFVKSWIEENPSARYILVESNPVPYVANIDKVVVLST